MSRGSYQRYRAQGVKTPAFAWLMDRKGVYIALGAVGAVVVGTQFAAADETISRMQAPYVPASPYQNVSASVMPAHEWAVSYLSRPAPGQTDWSLSTSYGPSNPAMVDKCSALGLVPKTLLATYTAGNTDVRASAQVYSPGQALMAYEGYKKSFAACGPVSSSPYDASTQTEVTSVQGGFFFTYGDAIVFVFSSDPKSRDAYMSDFVSRAATSLVDGGCKDLGVSSDDPKRNLFAVGSKSFTGLLLSESVDTKVPLKNLPNPIIPTVRDPGEMDQPEGPLSPLIPRMPSAPERPKVQENPDDNPPTFTVDVRYQADDPEGPGCGWLWTDASAPVTDDALMEKNRVALLNKTQLQLDTKARTYIDAKINHARGALSSMSKVAVWNTYTDRVEAVHDKWSWLNDEREKVKTPWYNYVDAYRNWRTFDERKAQAQSQYTADVQRCEAANRRVDEWNAQWLGLYNAQNSAYAAPSSLVVRPASYRAAPTPAPNPARNTPAPSQTAPPLAPTPVEPTPVDPSPVDPSPVEPEPTPEPTIEIPPRPEGCGGVSRPDILGQVKGAQPRPPALAKGVTIPSSWPRP